MSQIPDPTTTKIAETLNNIRHNASVAKLISKYFPPNDYDVRQIHD
jgi:hypothetical protein